MENYEDNRNLITECLKYKGMSENCEELTTLRKFRDEYMKSTKGGCRLVEEYYAVAPKIVEKINASDKKNKYYQYIYEVIEKCVRLIGCGENERTLKEYKFMVTNLKKEFNL